MKHSKNVMQLWPELINNNIIKQGSRETALLRWVG